MHMGYAVLVLLRLHSVWLQSTPSPVSCPLSAHTAEDLLCWSGSTNTSLVLDQPWYVWRHYVVDQDETMLRSPLTAHSLHTAGA
jgi:hypothetical protein